MSVYSNRLLPAAILTGCLLPAAMPGVISAIEVVQESVDSPPLEPSGASFNASLSGTGRYVVFTDRGLASRTQPNVYLRDRDSQSTELISVLFDPNNFTRGSSFDPSVSDDGRRVTYHSDDQNQVENDESAWRDVFLRDTTTSTTTLLTVSTTGGASDLNSTAPAISGDGQFVVFESIAENLVSEDGNNRRDVFIHNLGNATTQLISVANTGMGPGNGNSSAAAISRDGSMVAFVSAATDLLGPDSNSATDVFVRELLTGTTVLISMNQNGSGPGNGASSQPAISADGRYVAFSSTASDLVANDFNGVQDIFVRDILNGETRLVTEPPFNGLDGDSYQPSISGNGRFVAFGSEATNLITADFNDMPDVFVRDMRTEQIRLLSRDPQGFSKGGELWGNSTISDDGGLVAFTSVADGLVPGDNDMAEDVFVATTLDGSGPVFSAVLPASRSLFVGQTGTLFASVINSANTAAINCRIAPTTTLAADFSYQATTADNNLTGIPDSRVDIAAGAVQNFVLSFTPTAPISPTDIELDYDCANTDSALSTVGLNSVLLSADANPIPDVIALTTVVDLIASADTTTLFAVGSANVGITGDITVSVDDAGRGLPVAVSICATDVTGACASPPGDTATLSYTGGDTAAFAVFVTPTDTIANDPANNRLFIRFADSNDVVRGATSTAVRTE